MTAVIDASSVGINPPDPHAVEWLETEYTAQLARGIGRTYSPSVFFHIVNDTEWEKCMVAGCCMPDDFVPVIIEPNDDVIAAANADFRDGFWRDVPFEKSYDLPPWVGRK